MTTRLRLASFPHVSYLPQFIAQALGYFADEGLAVSLTPHAGDWAALLAAPGAHAVELIVGNIWFALRPSPGASRLLPVAHAMQQSRFMLYRGPGLRQPFDWRQLEGAVVLIASEVPTPWIAFREALQRQGLSLDRVRAVTGYPARDAAAALARGEADFALLGIEDGLRHGFDEAAALADTIGPVPWSVYLTGASELAAHAPVYRAFQRAIGRALADIQQRESAELAELAAPWFPNLDQPTATRIIDRYRALDAWPATPDLVPEHLARWHDAMVRWGLLREPVDWQPLLRFIDDPAA